MFKFLVTCHVSLVFIEPQNNVLFKTIKDVALIIYRLGRYAVESYLEQILSHGFFHADPVSS